ncbi:MAG: methylated-DNA--[protein]-cysteine S-methyltransferase [Zoogloea sp.]|nr:methylated-DNA--[protein]-cysteine S-methyltransferase [Zoogloea sp.]MDD3354541.1 methylated-DNA--[protein]-cysteine S-methyltransferase [Zoogloea sp.]
MHPLSSHSLHSTGRSPVYSAVIPAPFGRLGILIAGTHIQEIVFLPPEYPLHPPSCLLSTQAALQLESYWRNPDHPFLLPLKPSGTPFRRRVWAAIAAIPRGQTRTYGALAQQLGSGARAVGQACGDNPFPIAIPCHRVISSRGPGGFAHESSGFLMEAKRWLLHHEISAACALTPSAHVTP